MATTKGPSFVNVNDTVELHNPSWCKICGHNSYVSRIIANFVSKFPKFCYYGNKGRFFNSSEAVK